MRRITIAGACGAALALWYGVAMAADFSVVSTDLQDGRFPQSHYASTFGCTGANLSPDLAWSGAPAGTKSFAVTIYDPDAPTGSGWWHWVMVNVPASVSSLPQGASSFSAPQQVKLLPPGVTQVTGDIGQPGYLGPCPPQGQTHRYVISVTALKVDHLELPANATAALAGFMINANSLGKATLTVTAGR